MSIYVKVFPLSALIYLGFLATRIHKVRKEGIASLLIYFVTPLIVFKGVLMVPLDQSRLLLPVFTFTLGTFFCLVLRPLAEKFFPRPASNILAYTVGNCNSGYVGLPLAVALLGEAAFAQAVMLSFGFILYENTLGFYVTARGQHSRRESLAKVLVLPSLYAFVAGLILNHLGMRSLGFLEEVFTAARGAYLILGMMLIGMALADLKERSFDLKFCAFAFVAKYLLWPGTVGLFLYFDREHFHLFDSFARKGIIVVAFLPLAANMVALASALKAEPEKSSVAVLMSLILSFLLLPLVELLLHWWS